MRSRPARKTVAAAAVPRRAQPAGAGAGAGRITGGFQRLPDAGVLVRISRGRLWIAVLGALLLGIVAVNLASLRLGAGTGQTAQRIQGISQQSSELRALLAQRSATEAVHAEAVGIGMIMPEPGAIRYLSLGAGSAERAAERLREIGVAGSAASATAPVGAEGSAGVEVAAPTPVAVKEDSAPGLPPAPDPAEAGAGGGGPP